MGWSQKGSTHLLLTNPNSGAQRGMGTVYRNYWLRCFPDANTRRIKQIERVSRRTEISAKQTPRRSVYDCLCMPDGGSGRKIGCGLASAGSAAVFAVFLAGNLRTQSAVRQFAREMAEKRVAGMVQRRVRSVEEGLHWQNSGVPVAPSPTGSVAPATPKEHWKDGTYTGWGFSPHGDIEAAVRIEGGQIVSAIISQCRTRYSCGVIELLPGQVVARQSPDVDYVSGATQSADAFYEAVLAALQKARG